MSLEAGLDGLEIHQAHPTRLLDAGLIERVVLRVCSQEGFSIRNLGVILGDHALIHELNRTWLDHDYETDVLSFGLDESAAVEKLIDGEVYVDLDTAEERAAEFGETLEREALRYIVHGVLHLVGYDDATEELRSAMRQREDLALADPRQSG